MFCRLSLGLLTIKLDLGISFWFHRKWSRLCNIKSNLICLKCISNKSYLIANRFYWIDSNTSLLRSFHELWLVWRFSHYRVPLILNFLASFFLLIWKINLSPISINSRRHLGWGLKLRSIYFNDLNLGPWLQRFHNDLILTSSTKWTWCLI